MAHTNGVETIRANKLKLKQPNPFQSISVTVTQIQKHSDNDPNESAVAQIPEKTALWTSTCIKPFLMVH